MVEIHEPQRTNVIDPDIAKAMPGATAEAIAPLEGMVEHTTRPMASYRQAHGADDPLLTILERRNLIDDMQDLLRVIIASAPNDANHPAKTLAEKAQRFRDLEQRAHDYAFGRSFAQANEQVNPDETSDDTLAVDMGQDAEDTPTPDGETTPPEEESRVVNLCARIVDRAETAAESDPDIAMAYAKKIGKLAKKLYRAAKKQSKIVEFDTSTSNLRVYASSQPLHYTGSGQMPNITLEPLTVNVTYPDGQTTTQTLSGQLAEAGLDAFKASPSTETRTPTTPHTLYDDIGRVFLSWGLELNSMRGMPVYGDVDMDEAASPVPQLPIDTQVHYSLIATPIPASYPSDNPTEQESPISRRH